MAKHKRNQKEHLFKSYVCTSIQLIPQGKYITKTYDELLTSPPKDNRTGTEVAADFIKRHGLKMEVE